MTDSTDPKALALARLSALIAMMVLAHITFTGGRVALSLYAIRLQASTFTVGALISLLSVLPMLLSVHMGRWSDRVGIVRPGAIALSLVTLGTLLPALKGSVPVLCVASVLLGTGFMLMHVAVSNAVGHASTAATRTRAFTLLALGFSTSTVLGPVIAGFCIDHLGHGPTFAQQQQTSIAISALHTSLSIVSLFGRIPRFFPTQKLSPSPSIPITSIPVW